MWSLDDGFAELVKVRTCQVARGNYPKTNPTLDQLIGEAIPPVQDIHGHNPDMFVFGHHSQSSVHEAQNFAL
jgi:hypothetical protein